MLGINKRAVRALKATPGSLSFSRKSDDADTLQHMLTDGTITKLHSPKDVYMMRAEFQKYDLKSFRNGLYGLKNETGFNLRNVPETEEAETPPAAAARVQSTYRHSTYMVICQLIVETRTHFDIFWIPLFAAWHSHKRC